MQHDEINAVKLKGDGSGILNLGNQSQLIYVSKTGSDSSSGININESKLTINAAVTAASLLTPAVGNQITIEVLDTSDYTEDVDLPEWVHIDASSASLNGTLDVSDNCIVLFRRLQKTTTGGSVVKKTTGTGFAKVGVDILIVSDSAQNGVLLNMGVMHVDAGVISVDGGIGVKAKNGSRISFVISELQLLNGGAGIGTQVAGGDPNFFSGNILYAKDDGSGTFIQSKVSGDIINIQGGSFIVDKLYDIDDGSTLNVFATEAVGDVVSEPLAIINATLAGVSGNVTVINVSSFVNQDPVGTDNPLQVTYGAGEGTASDPVMVDAAGLITFNQKGRYKLIFGGHFGRSTGVGEAHLLGRFLVNGTQGTNTMYAILDDQKIALPFETTSELEAVAGMEIVVQIIRDSAGVDNGGLTSYSPTLAGVEDANSVQLTIIKLS
jgi:hypothetical protein